MHALLDDDRGQLTLKRLWPWHRVLARSRAARLDRELAEGASPEASASLAARAVRLTSTEFRADLAASLRRILVAAGEPALPVAARPPRGSALPLPMAARPLPMAARPLPMAARPLRVPLRTTRVRQAAPLLAELAGRLLEPGPVPVRGVALVTCLLSDGAGPLYREAARGDLGAMAERAADALTW
jgi:hypothetical protein